LLTRQLNDPTINLVRITRDGCHVNGKAGLEPGKPSLVAVTRNAKSSSVLGDPN